MQNMGNIGSANMNDYKDFIVKAHQKRNVTAQTQKNLTSTARGVGRMEKNLLDTFILTRKLTFP